MKSIFVSHVYEDQKWLNKMKKWDNEKKIGNYTFTFETKDLRHKGMPAIKDHLKNKIKGADTLLILIGKDTHNHPWIKYEYDLAKSYGKNILCMQIPYEIKGAIPNGIGKHDVFDFNPNTITSKLK